MHGAAHSFTLLAYEVLKRRGSAVSAAPRLEGFSRPTGPNSERLKEWGGAFQDLESGEEAGTPS